MPNKKSHFFGVETSVVWGELLVNDGNFFPVYTFVRYIPILVW
jgi:hypothetical protein